MSLSLAPYLSDFPHARLYMAARVVLDPLFDDYTDISVAVIEVGNLVKYSFYLFCSVHLTPPALSGGYRRLAVTRPLREEVGKRSALYWRSLVGGSPTNGECVSVGIPFQETDEGPVLSVSDLKS